MKLRNIVLSATALTALASSPGAALGQAIVGRVVDAASGDGVPEARVTVTGRDPRDVRQALTAADGRFAVELGDGGSYRVQVARAGYQVTRSRPVTVTSNDTVAIELRVSSAAVRLDPLAVTARTRRLTVVGVFGDVYDGGGGPTIAKGWRRRIVVTGTILTPSACYRTAGGASRTGPIVTLNVQARPTGGTCPDVPTAFAYKATVHGLPPGTYTLQVLNTFRNHEWEPRMALDTTITVR